MGFIVTYLGTTLASVFTGSGSDGKMSLADDDIMTGRGVF